MKTLTQIRKEVARILQPFYNSKCVIKDGNCSNIQGSVTMCNTHYLRMKRHGDTSVSQLVNVFDSKEKRFWQRVKISTKKKCWEWQGTVFVSGYGQFRDKGKVIKTHRFMLEWFLGKKILKHVLHSCHNPICVNPYHLREGTHLENMQDKQTNGKTRKPSVQLSKQDVRQIKQMLKNGESALSIASKFGKTYSCILNVKHGKTWKKVSI